MRAPRTAGPIIVVGVLVSAVAPMFIVLHVVLVAAFGLLVPYRLYRAGISGARRRGIAVP